MRVTGWVPPTCVPAGFPIGRPGGGDVSDLSGVRATLEADGYGLEVSEGERVDVRITAGPDACADCLVPEPIMREVLARALEVPSDRIDLTYPEP